MSAVLRVRAKGAPAVRHRLSFRLAGSWCWIGLGCALAPWLARSAPAKNDLAPFEEMWKRGQYEEALQKLLVYRDQTHIRDQRLDYMIATSACRTGRQQAGSEFFEWILFNYPLSGENRALVESEKQRCSKSTRPQGLRITTPTSLVGVTYHGKGGFTVTATGSGNSAAEMVTPIAPAAFARRLFAPGSWEAAKREIANTAGEDSKVEHVGHFLLVVPARPKAPDSGASSGSTGGEIPNQAATPLNAASPRVIAALNDLRPEAGNAPANARAPAVNRPGVNPANLEPAGVNAANVSPPNVNERGGDAPEAVRESPNAGSTNQSAIRNQPATPNRAATPNQPAAPNDASRAVRQMAAPARSMVQQPVSTSAEPSGVRHAGEDLENYLQFFVSEYGMQPPSHLITVYFTPNVEELQSLARRIHGIQLAPGSIGYSFPADQSMAGWADGRAYGTFAHELFHVMVRNNFGDIPPWLDEGMAALYEVSRWDGNRAVGVPNWRGRILHDLWTSRPALRNLVQMNRTAFDYVQGRSDRLAAGENQAANHATARYFMLYLQERGKLKPVYMALLNRRVSGQPAKQAVDLVERAVGRSLDDVDADFSQWFQSQPAMWAQ